MPRRWLHFLVRHGSPCSPGAIRGRSAARDRRHQRHGRWFACARVGHRQVSRGTSSANLRGSSYDRRRRREWIRGQFGSSSGKTVKCYWCPKVMRTNFEVDRWPVCGHDGGRYTRSNVVPSCPECNRKRCTASKKCRGGSGHVRVDRRTRSEREQYIRNYKET